MTKDTKKKTTKTPATKATVKATAKKATTKVSKIKAEVVTSKSTKEPVKPLKLTLDEVATKVSILSKETDASRANYYTLNKSVFDLENKVRGYQKQVQILKDALIGLGIIDIIACGFIIFR